MSMTLGWFIGTALAVGCGNALFLGCLILVIKREVRMRQEAINKVKECMVNNIKDVKTVTVHASCGPIKFDFDIVK